MGEFDGEIRGALARQQAGDLAGGEAGLRAVLERAPGMAMVSALLGHILNETGRAAETVEMLTPIAEAEPHRPLVRLSLGMALNKLDRAGEAIEHLEAACVFNPSDVQSQFWRGATLERLERIEDAEIAFVEAIEAAAQSAGALAQLGERFFVLERMELSARCYERVIAGGARGAGVLLRLATVYQALRRFEDALDASRRAMAAEPRNVSAYMALADNHEKLHHLDKAAAAAREGLRLDPGHTVLSRILARVERRLGRPKRGDEIIRRALGHEIVDARLLGPLLIEHGHVLDAMGEYGRAYEAFSAGKAAWLETVRERFDLGAFPKQLDERLEAARAIGSGSAVAGGGAAAGDPVFFVGFPRSGTTLMEQALAAHPGVITMDEVDLLERVVMRAAREMVGRRGEGDVVAALDDAQAGELRGLYLEEAWRRVGGDSGGGTGGDDCLLIDKLPLHITRIGLIRRVFPCAKILVALRDPRDCCLSAFMQSFDGNEAMVQFHSLESSARMYGGVMGLWLEVRGSLGGLFYEYRYEDLTLDFEGTVRGVLGFLGLEWSDDILEFQERARGRSISTPSYERVVSKIDRKAVGRWRRYESHMGEALGTLQKYVEAFGYGD